LFLEVEAAHEPPFVAADVRMRIFRKHNTSRLKAAFQRRFMGRASVYQNSILPPVTRMRT
jgi:hypothetical protein